MKGSVSLDRFFISLRIRLRAWTTFLGVRIFFAHIVVRLIPSTNMRSMGRSHLYFLADESEQVTSNIHMMVEEPVQESWPTTLCRVMVGKKKKSIGG